MRNIQILLQHPSVSKWIKWVLVLLATRVQKPFLWASFLSLNPLIKQVLAVKQVKQPLQRVIGARKSASETEKANAIQRRLDKISNVASVALLYFATASNNNFPKDYVSIYLWFSYYGELDKPSASKVLVSPWTSRLFKVENYSQFWRSLYKNKEYVIYPLIFGQILSNYLTPTKYKFNQRYLSSSIKERILNPIWINYSLSAKSHYIDWVQLAKSYLGHNLAIGAFIALMAFKTRALDKYYELKYGISTTQTLPEIAKQYWLYVFHKANSYTNFIYAPNLIAMLLISMTAPLLPSTKSSRQKIRYLRNSKRFFKTYIKSIGVVAGFVTLYLNSQEFIPDFGYKREPEEKQSPRTISKTFLDGLNLYLFRLILLSKWRITKENHPSFRKVKLATWYKLETVLMCIGVYKLMTLNDFTKRSGVQREEIESSPLIKMVDKIM